MTKNAIPDRSAWAEKLRLKRLQNESDKVRKWQEQAESPNTPSETLVKIADNAYELWKNHWSCHTVGDGITALEAVASNPNTPLKLLQQLIVLCPSGFCTNPIAPFLLLEDPGFVANLGDRECAALLREENTPSALILALSGRKPTEKLDSFASRYHVAVAGEVASQMEWKKGVHQYWRDYCASVADPSSPVEDDRYGFKKEQRRNNAQEHCDLAEVGLAPRWALNAPFFVPPPRAPQLSPAAKQWLRFAYPLDHPRTKACWKQIAPGFRDLPYRFAGHLYANATPADLFALTKMSEVRKGEIGDVIACHPSMRSELLNFLPYELRNALLNWGGPCDFLDGHDLNLWYKRLLLITRCPSSSPELLAKISQASFTGVRRAARRHFNAPKNVRWLGRQAIFRHHRRNEYRDTAFVQFCLGVRGGFDRFTLHLKAHDDLMGLRLLAALTLPATAMSIPYDAPKRTHHDLLMHLAHDGSQLVRWAAQTRLADPDFVFRWQDE